MDAAKPLFSRTTSLLIAATLLSSAAAYAQPAFSLSTTAVTPSSSPGQPTYVTVSSTSTITYQAVTTYTAVSAPSNNVKWLCIGGPNGTTQVSCDNVTGITTPNTLAISLGQQAGLLTIGQQYMATITLTPTDNSGATPATITVTYTPGSANSGTGVITASSLSVSSSSSYCLGEASTTFTLSTTSTSPISFSLSTGTSWDSVSPSTGTVAAGAPATITVTMNGNGQSCTQLSDFITVAYNGTSFNISVVFGNGVAVNGGGSGSTGSLTATPNPVSLSYVSNSNNFPSQYVTINGNSGVTFNAVASSSTNWLLVNQNNQINTVLVPAQVLISANTNAQNLTAGTSYSGTVTFYGSDGSVLQLPVNLAVQGTNNTGITISPNPVAISAAYNGSSVTQAVTITSTIGGAVSATITGTGLSVTSPTNTNLAANGSTSVTVTANPSGLANATTYNGTLNVTVGSQTLSAPVNFSVGSGSSTGGTGSIGAAPSSLTFVYQANVGSAAPASQTVLLTGSGNYTASPTTQNGGQWLSVFPQSGTLPASSFSVSVNPASLQAGTYTGAVTFTNSSSGTTSVVSVTLNVYNSAAIYASPGDMIFSFVGNTTTAQFQDLSLIGTSGSLTTALAVTNPSNTPWLTVSQSSSSGIYFVTVNASSLANGVYTGYLSATATGASNSLSIPVVVNVTGSSNSGGSGNLSLSPSSLTFPENVGGSSTQTITVGASTTTSFTASASTNGSGNNTWLSISPSGSLSTNTTITVTANAAGLSAGTYNGTITLTSTSGTQTVGVTMVVGGSGTGGTLSVSVNGAAATTSPSVSFTATSVNGSVAGQYITVSSASGASGVSFIATLSGSSCAWVSLGITQNQSYQTQVNIPIGATTTGLAAGTYSCTLTLTPSGGGAAVTVPLSLTVVGAPSISVPTTTLNFSYAAGTAAPASQTVQLTNPGSAAATFTAATSVTTPSGGTWLTATPTSGSVTPGTPFTLTVSVNTNGLNAGTYNGTITVTAGSGAGGGGTIPVQLVVTAPTPAITSIVNGASFLGNNSSVAPGEFISIFGSSLGPLTPLGPSIGSNDKVSTSAGGVQVLFDATPAPLTYVSSGQINCVVPYEVNGLSTVTVTVQYLGVSANSTTLSVVATSPGIFSASGSGTGGGAILNQNSLLNTSANPAPIGSVIQIYLTGEGITNPQQADGAITPYPPATVPVAKPITVTIGGQPATYTFAGEAPGEIAGIMQINVMVPPGATSGAANPLVVTIGGGSSQQNLTVYVQ